MRSGRFSSKRIGCAAGSSERISPSNLQNGTLPSTAPRAPKSRCAPRFSSSRFMPSHLRLPIGHADLVGGYRHAAHACTGSRRRREGACDPGACDPGACDLGACDLEGSSPLSARGSSGFRQSQAGQGKHKLQSGHPREMPPGAKRFRQLRVFKPSCPAHPSRLPTVWFRQGVRPGERPGDRKRRVVPADTALARRVVESPSSCRSTSAVSESTRKPCAKPSGIHSISSFAGVHSAAAGRSPRVCRSPANLAGHRPPHPRCGPRKHPYQLALRLAQLVVQPAQNAHARRATDCPARTPPAVPARRTSPLLNISANHPRSSPKRRGRQNLHVS